MVNNTGDGIGEHGNEGPSAGTLEEHGGTNNQSDNYRNTVHGVALALEIGKFYFAVHDDSNNQGHDSSCIHAEAVAAQHIGSQEAGTCRNGHALKIAVDHTGVAVEACQTQATAHSEKSGNDLAHNAQLDKS